MTRAKGAHRSAPSKIARAVPLEHHPEVRARLEAHRDGRALLPADVDLSSFQPAILDQGQSGSCEPHSGSACLYTAFRARGEDLGFLPSQRLLYAAARARARALSTPIGSPLVALEDTGLETADLMATFADYGVGPMGATPGLVNGLTPDGRLSDIWTKEDTGDAAVTNIADEADIASLLVAGRRPIVGPYFLDPTPAAAGDTIVAALASGIPLQVAFFCDGAFEALQPGEAAAAPVLADTSGGGHAVYCAGVRTVNGVRVWRITNSWGPSWCDGGRCDASDAWRMGAWEFWPYAIGGLS